MRAPSVFVSSLALAVIFAGAQAYDYTETHFVGEPWSGWYWPMYDCGPNGGPYMWQGGMYGNDSGPIYDLDTRYFWRDGAARNRAQVWEYLWHRTTQYPWWGHCWGVSCAQALEDDPPADNGALSRDDLEGLLAELYSWCAFIDLGNGEPEIRPSDMWLALQRCMIPGSQDWGRIVVDFSRLVDAQGNAEVWNWPVYGYKVEYDMPSPDLADGVMTLYYEGHEFNTLNAPDFAKYEFRCKMNGVGAPRPRTGWWDAIIRAPGDPRTYPDWASKPTVRQTDVYDYDYHSTNYYLWQPEETLDIRRVIEHKTIVMDDPYMYLADPYPPPGGEWVQRPGFGGSCWAAPTYYGQWPNFAIEWRPRLGASGVWRFEVYKTHPAEGDELCLSAHCYFWGFGDDPVYYNQNEAPFDTWVPLGPSCILNQGDIFGWINTDFYYEGDPCLTYMDAFKAIYIGPAGGEGGQSASSSSSGVKVCRTSVTPSHAVSTARINYLVEEPGRVDIAVYDVMGRLVLKSPQGMRRAGVQAASISVARLSTGTYMARVSVNGVNSTCRFVVYR